MKANSRVEKKTSERQINMYDSIQWYKVHLACSKIFHTAYIRHEMTFTKRSSAYNEKRPKREENKTPPCINV